MERICDDEKANSETIDMHNISSVSSCFFAALQVKETMYGVVG